MPTKKFNGINARVKISTSTIQDEVSADLSMTIAEIPTASKDDGQWFTWITGDYSWEVKMTMQWSNELAVSTKKTSTELFTTALAGTALAINFGTHVAGDTGYSGNAIITSIAPKAERNSVAMVEITAKGTGALTSAVYSS